METRGLGLVRRVVIWCSAIPQSVNTSKADSTLSGWDYSVFQTAVERWTLGVIITVCLKGRIPCHRLVRGNEIQNRIHLIFGMLALYVFLIYEM